MYSSLQISFKRVCLEHNEVLMKAVFLFFTCKCVILRSMFIAEVSQFSETYL